MMTMGESLSRPPTYQDGTSFVSASVATHSHTSPAPSGALFAAGTFFCLAWTKPQSCQWQEDIQQAERAKAEADEIIADRRRKLDAAAIFGVKLTAVPLATGSVLHGEKSGGSRRTLLGRMFNSATKAGRSRCWVKISLQPGAI
jgi:hypothetical protein